MWSVTMEQTAGCLSRLLGQVRPCREDTEGPVSTCGGKASREEQTSR